MYAGGCCCKAGRQFAADPEPGILHQRCRYFHLGVLSGAVGADRLESAPGAGRTTPSAANAFALRLWGGSLYGCGMALPQCNYDMEKLFFCGSLCRRRRCGLSAGIMAGRMSETTPLKDRLTSLPYICTIIWYYYGVLMSKSFLKNKNTLL